MHGDGSCPRSSAMNTRPPRRASQPAASPPQPGPSGRSGPGVASGSSQSRRQPETAARSSSCGASQPVQGQPGESDVTGATPRALTLMADIRKLGLLPRRGPGHEAEHALAKRLRSAKQDKILSHSQLAFLEKLPEPEIADRAADRALSLVADIRALGHLPRRGPGHEAEHALAHRLRNAKRNKLLSLSLIHI